MGTKQFRLSDPDQIKNKIGSFVGKNITIVLSDDTAMFGELNAVYGDEILLVNMRLKKIRYPLANIVEIYLDTNV